MKDASLYREYEHVMRELEQNRKIVTVATEGLKAVIQSGQINIAERTLEAIDELQNGKEA